ncbi:MAG: prepilin-type N-terminal cleavage/methylation domain-containing protein [Gammaproteobacteria bacterium]|nr:prepilin-type N-terminal cleavage/methylation domain-containing protein [Gammaproteobacteria bacterium]MDH5802605.1 prepilin-type N-terminal cleavage/methylation domain-containing protein [Gammaproteobacteria bacterium]
MTNQNTSHGFTLIELIIVVAIFSIFASIALPDLATTMARAALKDAAETTALALRKAKTLARTENTNINVNFIQNSGAITLSLPDDTVVQTISLSRVTAVDSASYRFNGFGTVNNTGTISLKSTYDPALRKNITIATLSGQILSQ